MQWTGLEFQSLIDSLAILSLVAGALYFIARRGLRAIRPARSGSAALELDRSEQSTCNSCSVAKAHKT